MGRRGDSGAGNASEPPGVSPPLASNGVSPGPAPVSTRPSNTRVYDFGIPDPANDRLAPITERTHALDPKTLTEFQRRVLYEEVARRLIERHPRDRICLDLAISNATLRRVLRDDEFRVVFEDVRERIMGPVDAALRDERMGISDRIDLMASRALTKLGALLDNASAEIQRKASDSILDRHPLSARVRRVVGASFEHMKLDDDTLASLERIFGVVSARGKVITLPPSSAKEPR